MDDLLTSHPELLALSFPLLWVGVLSVIAHMGGWARVAAEYRAHEPAEGRSWSFQSGQFGWGNYNRCLTVGASSRGIHLSVLWLFRPSHPPVFVPWEDVSATEEKGILFRYMDLRFRRAPEVRVRLRKGLADRIRAEAGSRWPGGPAEATPIEPR